MLKHVLPALCVLAAAAPLAAPASSNVLKPVNIGGRWTGTTYTEKSGGALTLDIVACGNAWCGIKVEAGGKCGGTALRLAHVAPAPDDGNDGVRFDGALELAPGTEPYVVQAWLLPPTSDTPVTLQVTGDTGGTFRIYRRSFPFEAQMVRTQDAVCHAPQAVSSLR